MNKDIAREVLETIDRYIFLNGKLDRCILQGVCQASRDKVSEEITGTVKKFADLISFNT